MMKVNWSKAPAGIKGLADSPRGYVWFTEFHYWYADNSVTKWLQFGAPGHLRFTDLTHFQYAVKPETTAITTAPQVDMTDMHPALEPVGIDWSKAPDWADGSALTPGGLRCWFNNEQYQHFSLSVIHKYGGTGEYQFNQLTDIHWKVPNVTNPKWLTESQEELIDRLFVMFGSDWPHVNATHAIVHENYKEASSCHTRNFFKYVALKDGKFWAIDSPGHYIVGDCWAIACRREDFEACQVATSETASTITTAPDFLSAGMKILTERGQQYGSDDRECSFPQAAAAFNAITGHNLKGSDICLIVALIKQVRQYAQPERFHQDSAVDGVNYTALQAQELKRERGGV